MNTQNKNTNIHIIEPDLLLAAYAGGFFPMAEGQNGPIRWYCPDPRAIIPLDKFKITRSLRQTIKKNLFTIRLNTAFEEVIRSCAQRRETWISEEIIQSYLLLHKRGYAHSVEAWQDELLAGGLYGVTFGGAFFGESMFTRKTDASKVALVYLVRRLCERKFELLDIQFITPHLSKFGAIEISRSKYLQILKRAINQRCSLID